MPLILMSGFPCSGKTRCAIGLKKYFEENKNVPTKVISDHNFEDLNRNDLYSNSSKEKEIRSLLKSEVQRSIDKSSVIILDSPNYIKGFRYELYCVSKSAQTTQCTILCSVSNEKSIEINSTRQPDEQYTNDVLNELIMRFETPDPKNRWDSPMFVINFNDEIPFEDIYTSLFLKKAPAPHLSTLPTPILATNLLHEIDKCTQRVVQEIMEGQKFCMQGDKIKINSSDEKITYLKTFTLAELQNSKRQFISFAKTRNIEDISSIPSSFVQFINSRV
ncbi:hypothetical protein HELRODRAFT_100688, partial [Helobdella robusta]|uniref:Protein KTI12 homolog n=1 Tax=Helobdella robusta TaxID=6412 RepID=T1ED12_HELRO